MSACEVAGRSYPQQRPDHAYLLEGPPCRGSAGSSTQMVVKDYNFRVECGQCRQLGHNKRDTNTLSPSTPLCHSSSQCREQ